MTLSIWWLKRYREVAVEWKKGDMFKGRSWNVQGGVMESTLSWSVCAPGQRVMHLLCPVCHCFLTSLKVNSRQQISWSQALWLTCYEWMGQPSRFGGPSQWEGRPASPDECWELVVSVKLLVWCRGVVFLGQCLCLCISCYNFCFGGLDRAWGLLHARQRVLSLSKSTVPACLYRYTDSSCLVLGVINSQ